MGDIKNKGNSRAALTDLDGIEGLLQQVDVMVGVGSLSSFPDVEDIVTSAAKRSPAKTERSDAASESLLDDLDSIETFTPQPQHFKRVDLQLPPHGGVDIRLLSLRKYSAKNVQVLQAADEDRSLLAGFVGIAVLPGQVFARVVTLDQNGAVIAEKEAMAAESNMAEPVIVIWQEAEIEAGAYISLVAGEYRAERYGYLLLEDNCFSVVTPFFVSPDQLQVAWGVFSMEPLSITPSMLQQWFEEIGIKPEFLDVDKVERLSRALNAGEQKRGVFSVATGRKPVDGVDGRVDLLVEMERPSGIERPDGSVDFREVNYLPNVEAGQLVAHRVPPIPGTPGMDVTGGEIAPSGGAAVVLNTDKTVRCVKAAAGVELYYAEQAGVVRYQGQALSVVNILTLEKGVDYETGNINFAGDVFIKGTVAEGFSVRAGGSVTVTETVSEGAEIVSVNGDVTVGRGVVGRRTKIAAKGTVRVQFAHDATIRAGGDIVVGNYLYNADIFAGENVEVRKGEGARGGSVWGGRTVALQVVQAWSVGSPSWIVTEVVAGFDPEATEKRERVDGAITKTSQHLNRILDVFELSRLDPELIRATITKAVGKRRRFLEQQARLLGQLATSYKTLLEMRQGLLAEASAEQKVRSAISIRGTAYPEVTIRVKRQTLKLNREYDAVTFKSGEKGIETF